MSIKKQSFTLLTEGITPICSHNWIVSEWLYEFRSSPKMLPQETAQKKIAAKITCLNCLEIKQLKHL